MTTSFLAQLAARPERALWVLMLVQLALWTLAPLLSHSAPPLDVVEMQAHGREWVVATFKHPNLPGIVLEVARVITGGAAGWPAFVVSQLCVIATFAFVFALGRDLMDARRALVGTALLTGVYFFSWPTPEFNHNVLPMPLWALTIWALWRATTKGGLGWWVLLGAAAGFSLWAKYSSAILLLVAGIWMLHDGRARKKLLTPGPWITFVVCVLVFAPQAVWLTQNDFAPFAYAARRATSVDFIDTLAFLPIQLAHHLPMFLLMLCVGLFGKPVEAPPIAPEKRALRFLLLMGLGPAIVITLIGLVSASGLRTAWGAPMFTLSGLIAVALLTNKIDDARTRGAFVGGMMTIALIAALYWGHMQFGHQLTGKPLRGNWPQAEITETLEREWATQTNNAPLRIVAGDIWTGGMIDMDGRPPPSVLINGDYAISPWITPHDVERYGALVVWSGAVPPTLEAFAANYPKVERDFYAPNSHPENRQPVRVTYAIIPPRAP